MRTITLKWCVNGKGMTNIIRSLYYEKDFPSLLSLSNSFKPSITIEQLLGIVNEDLKIIGGLKVDYLSIVEDDGTDQELYYYIKKDLQNIEKIEETEILEEIQEKEWEGEKEWNIISLEEAWINPKGRVFKSGYMNHINDSFKLQKRGYIPIEMSNPHNWLMKNGWMKLTSGEFYSEFKKVSRRQLDTMWDYFEAHKKIKFNDHYYTDFTKLIENNEGYLN